MLSRCSPRVSYQRVDVLNVPGSGIARSSAASIGLVQGEHSYAEPEPFRQYNTENFINRLTRPSLGLPARIEIGDGTRTTVEAALHANETKTAVAVG